MYFKSRRDAGIKLAQLLLKYTNRNDVYIFALLKGGIPVAYEVSQRLNIPFDIFIVRKLGVPGQEELAMGAIASGGIEVLNEDVINFLKIPFDVVQRIIDAEKKEIENSERKYKSHLEHHNFNDKTIILIDDGLATGASMRVAIKALRALKSERIVVAVPTAPPETYSDFEDLADEIVCVITPQRFSGVGTWYEDFSQVSDDEVKELLLTRKSFI